MNKPLSLIPSLILSLLILPTLVNALPTFEALENMSFNDLADQNIRPVIYSVLAQENQEMPNPEINGNMYVYADLKRVGDLLEPIPERTSISFDNPVSGIRFERMMNGHSDIHISFSAHSFIPVTDTKELVKYFHVAIGVEEIERLPDRTIYYGTGNIAFDHDRYHEVTGWLEVSADEQTATFIAEPLLT